MAVPLPVYFKTKAMKTTKILLSAVLMSASLLLFNCKKDKKSDPVNPSNPGGGGGTGSKNYVLVIENGAQTMEVGKSISLSAHLVKSDGTVVNASGITWTSNLGGVSGNVFSTNTETTGVISASIHYEGVTYAASIPINVIALKTTLPFVVAPSAIIWGVGYGGIQLETVYLGGSANFSFSSANSNIASVSSTGLVTCNSPGNTTIKVSATINGQEHEFIIPVLVVGEPEVAPPVTRLALTPLVAELFRGETLQLNAKAFNKNGDDVTSSVSFQWSVIPIEEEDVEPGDPITVSASGMVTAKSVGAAYVRVTGAGLVAQAEIIVNPDSVILVSPFYAELGGFDPFTMQPNPDDKTFTAATYKVDRALYKAGNPNFLSTVANPSNLTWEVANTGIPEIDALYNVVTLSNKTNTSAKATKIAGKTGATVIIAHAWPYGGAAAIMVNP